MSLFVIFLFLIESSYSQIVTTCRTVTVKSPNSVECLLGAVPLNQSDALSQCNNIGGQLKTDMQTGSITSMWSQYGMDGVNRKVYYKNGGSPILPPNVAVLSSSNIGDSCLVTSWVSVPVFVYRQTNCSQRLYTLCELPSNSNKLTSNIPTLTMIYDTTGISTNTDYLSSCPSSSITNTVSWLYGNNPRSIMSQMLSVWSGTWLKIQSLQSADGSAIMIGWNTSSVSYRWVGPLIITDEKSGDSCFSLSQIPSVNEIYPFLYILEVDCSNNLPPVCSGALGLVTCQLNVVRDLTFSGITSDTQYSIPSGTDTSTLFTIHTPGAKCLSVVRKTFVKNIGFTQTPCSSPTFTSIICKNTCTTTPNNGYSVTMPGSSQACYSQSSFSNGINYWDALTYCQNRNSNLLYVENYNELLYLSSIFSMSSIYGTVLRMGTSINYINPANIIYLSSVPHSTMDTVLGFTYKADQDGCYMMYMTNATSSLNILQQTSCSTNVEAICVVTYNPVPTSPKTIQREQDKPYNTFTVYQSTIMGPLLPNQVFCTAGFYMTIELFPTDLLANNALNTPYWIGATLASIQGRIQFYNVTTADPTYILTSLVYLSTQSLKNVTIVKNSLSRSQIIASQGQPLATYNTLLMSTINGFDVYSRNKYMNMTMQSDGTGSIDYSQFSDDYQIIPGRNFWINLYVNIQGGQTTSGSAIYITNMRNTPIGYIGNMNLRNPTYTCLSLTKRNDLSSQITALPLVGYFIPATATDLNYGACQASNIPPSSNNNIEWSMINGVAIGFVPTTLALADVNQTCITLGGSLLNITSSSMATSILMSWTPSLVTNQTYINIWTEQQFNFLPRNTTSSTGVLSIKRFPSYATWVVQDDLCSTSKQTLYNVMNQMPTKNTLYLSSNVMTYALLPYPPLNSLDITFYDLSGFLATLDFLDYNHATDIWLNYNKSTGTPTTNSTYIAWIVNNQLQAPTSIPFIFTFDPTLSNYYYITKSTTSFVGTYIDYFNVQSNYNSNYLMCSKMNTVTTTTAAPTTTAAATTTLGVATTTLGVTTTTLGAITSTSAAASTSASSSVITSTSAPAMVSGSIQTSSISTQVTTTTSGNQQNPTSSTIIQQTTTAATLGSVTSITTVSTQTVTQATTSQATTQSSVLTTTVAIVIRNLTLPVENLLNIKYQNTSSHNWNFFYSPTCAIADNGSSTNFLNVLLQSRWPDTIQNYFTYANSTSYFTPVGVVQTLPNVFSQDTGLFRRDSPSLKLPGNGACLPLFSIQTDHPYNRDCLSQPEQCEYGFSAALWVKFQSNFMRSRDYLLTSGPDGTQGFKFYFSLGQLYLQIIGKNTMWSANRPMTKYVGSWMIVGFSWRRFTGEIRLLVGDQFTLFTNTMTMHNMNLNPSTTMYLGCISDLSGYSDPTTTPAMSVGHIGLWLWPVREKAILTGSYVYQMIRSNVPSTVPSTTPSPPVTFDFSKIISELVGNTTDLNPVYTSADEYICANNTVVPIGQVDLLAYGRGFLLNGKSSKIDVTQIRGFASSCPSVLTTCTNGLSMSMWLNIPNNNNSGDILEVVNNIRIVYMYQSVSVIVYNGLNSFGKSTTLIVFGVWQNLGLAINLGNQRLDLYINGIIDKSATMVNMSYFVRGASDSNVNNGDFVVGSGQSNSFVGVGINDISIWRRYLFHFESHRFVGYTLSQFSQLQNATNYWTTDRYINNDAVNHLQRIAMASTAPINLNYSLSSVMFPTSASLALDSDPFSKSSGTCPILVQQNTNYLFLARSKLLRTTYQDADINWSGQCLTDPCQDACRYSGITISMWLKIKSVSRSSMQFYFSSGDMANYPGAIIGRGISMFTDQQLFGVSLSTCTSYWNIIIDANRYSINQWMNIGILWREDIGFKLLINGIDYGLINSIPDQVYKPQDLGFRAVMGRFDTDDLSQWGSNGYWQMSNFVFGEMSYYTQYISPDTYASVIGLINNAYYADATWLRQGPTLIDQPIADLMLAKTLGQSYNYEGLVQWNHNVGAVSIVYGRVPVSIDSSTCPTNLNNCTAGFSLGGWFYIQNNLTTAFVSCYNVIIQGDMSTSGFGIQLCPNNSFIGWVNTNSFYSVTVPFVAFNANFNQWLFLGLIWQSQTGLILIINGNYFPGTVTGSSTGRAPNDRRIFVGDINANLKDSSNVLVFNTVFFNYNLNMVQLQKFLGLQYNQVLLISRATFFWTAYGLYYNLIRNQIQMAGVTYTVNKYDTSNSAICTGGSDQSFITLLSTTPHCLYNPDLCVSFVLIININLSPLISASQSSGFILTVGNNQTGLRGVSIIQSQNTMDIFVRNSTTTCRSTMLNYTTWNWVQLKLIWSSLKNPIVKVDENTKVAAVDAYCYSETNVVGPTTNIIIGQNPGQSLKATKVCISEVMLMHITSTADPESQSSGLFSSSCYQDMDLFYPLTGNANDQYQMPLGASSFDTATISDVLPVSCLTNPSTCTNGLTMSIWVKVDQIKGTDVALVNVGRPTRRGIGVSLSSGGNNSMYGISVSLHTGALLWTLKQDNSLSQSVWTNIGVAWNPLSGLTLFLNGLLVKSSTTSSMSVASDSTISTSIDIGKTVTGSISNVVVWFKVVAFCQSPQATRKALGGVCKLDSTLPVQVKCSIIANCINISSSLCVDETPTNVIQLSISGMKLTSPADSATILGIVYRVLRKTTPTTNLTVASTSLLMNVATNMIVTGPLTNPAAASLIVPFAMVNGELMTDNYLNDWTIMVNQSMYHPLLIIEAADNFYVKVSQQLSSLCTPLSINQGHLGITLMNIDVRQNLCKANFPNYLDSVWVQNGSTWNNSQDSITLSPQVIQQNGPVVALVSSMYLPTLVLPTLSSPSVSQNSTLTLNINSKIMTLTTLPAFPRTPNVTMVTIQLSLVNPNVRSNKIMAWDIIDPVNPNMTYQWFPSFWNNSLVPPNATYGTFDNLGCTPTSWNTTVVVFNCDHMTSFTILMQPIQPSNNGNIMQILSYLTIVGCVISMICLLIFIITIAASKSLRGTRYIIHLNMSCALFFALIALLLVQPAVQSQLFCQAIGVTMHLFFLATYSWFLIEALYVFYAVTSGVIDGKLKCYVPFGWCVPIIIVGVTAGLSMDSYGRNQFCWLSQTSVFLWAFLGPMIFLIVGAVVVSLVVVCNIGTPAVKGDVLDDVRDNIKQTAIIIPFILLGWMFGFIYLTTSLLPIAFVFVILCSLEGLWVLLFFGLMNPDFRYAICRRVRPRDSHESEDAILDHMEAEGSSRSSLRGMKKATITPKPPPKMNAPVYYSGNPKSRPPKHVDSVEASQASLNSERHLINQSYQDNEYVDEVDTNTIQNNGIPINYSRSIPGTPQYNE